MVGDGIGLTGGNVLSNELDPETLEFVLNSYSPQSQPNESPDSHNLSPPHSAGSSQAKSPVYQMLPAQSPSYPMASPNQHQAPDGLANQTSPMNTAPVLSPNSNACMYSPPPSGNEGSPPHLTDVESYLYSPQSEQGSTSSAPYSPNSVSNSSASTRQTHLSSTSDTSGLVSNSTTIP